jgi:anti-sigma factor RsiW
VSTDTRTREHDRDHEWTREESLWVDGRLDPESARELEARLASDPARAARLQAYREAMALWREEADREAARLEPSRLAERVLAGVGLRAEQERVRGVRAARRYAAAAVLLIGLGVGGALWIGARDATAGGESMEAALQQIERSRLDHRMDVEWELLPVIVKDRSREER